MVEFGLKLEDNKVSEWSEKYLNYEKLKAVLKKAKGAQTNYDEQAKKRPDDAANILKAHRAGDLQFVTTTPSHSELDLQDLPLESSSSSDLVVVAAAAANAMDVQPTERTSLVQSSIPMPPALRVDLNNPPIKRTLSGKFSAISEYFGSRYERTLRGYLEQIDRLSEEFEECLLDEQEKTVGFYTQKVKEQENRLQFLIESVVHSSLLAPTFVEQQQQHHHHHQDSTSSPYSSSSSPSAERGTAVPSYPQSPKIRRYAKKVEMTPQQRIKSVVNRVSKTIQKEKEILDALRKGDKEMALQIELLPVVDEDDDDQRQPKFIDNEKVLAEADSIKRALIDQYRTATLLKNFAIMNYTGFVKIIKKHDKSIPDQKGRFKGMLDVENLFNEGREVDALSKRLERYYANWFCEGDVREATAAMLPKKGDGLEMDWSQLRLGYRMGMCAVLALWVCWDCIWGLVSDGNATIGGRAAFPVFRACGGILLLQWFWGCSVFVWSRYRVNYIYLFDFDPRIVATPLSIFEAAVDNTLIFMLLMLLYYKSGANDIPQWIPTGWYPFILVLYTVTQLLFPLRTRLPMWEAIWKVITAPLVSPSFFHGYVGDIFTSMVKIFQDVAWTVCWVAQGEFTAYENLKDEANFTWVNAHWYKNVLIPIICLLPLLIRFNQCLRRYIDTGARFPHLANAAKYALSQTVTLFGAFHPLYMESTAKNGFNKFQLFWMLVFVTSSLYSFTWDVFMDWGLGQRKYGYLGPSLMYPKRSYYYITMGLDLVLRFMWVLTLIPPSSGAKFEVPSYLSAVTMMLELFRRTIWGFFRLENEHRSNAAGFRRVSFVPLHFNTGHHHRYSDKKERGGQAVLREVVLVSLVVVAVCVSSIIAAQNANLRVEL